MSLWDQTLPSQVATGSGTRKRALREESLSEFRRVSTSYLQCIEGSDLRKWGLYSHRKYTHLKDETSGGRGMMRPSHACAVMASSGR